MTPRTAFRTGTRLYVGHKMRHMPVIKAMRDAIAAGRIGQVTAVWCRHFISTGGDFHFKDWHADRSKTTGMLLQKGLTTSTSSTGWPVATPPPWRPSGR